MTAAADVPAPSLRTLEEAGAELRRAVRGPVESEAPIARITSFRLGGPAAILVEAEDEGDLGAAGRAIRRFGLPVLVLGRGSNVLVSDAGFPGVVLRLGRAFEWVSGEGTAVEAGGGTPLPRLANWAARRGLEGLEFTVAIPATVGGGVRMNAGAHSSSISDVLESATIYRLDDGGRSALKAAALAMEYRDAAIGPRDVVCSARFSLREGDPERIGSRMEAYRAHRARTQPAEAPNAGSMFKNPPGAAAGRLIEDAGLKGLRIGAVEVSRKHANFFLAHPGATAQQAYDLMSEVQRAVRERTGVLLVPEVRVVGSFDRSAGLEVAP